MLDIPKIDPFVLSVLKNHGWYEGREYDIKKWLDVLSKEGYVSFEYAEQVLKNLGGIFVSVSGDKIHYSATFHFDPVRGASGEYDRLEKFQTIAGEELYPLGEMVQAIAYVGKSRNVYFGDWREFYWIGDSIEDYLNNLFKKGIKPKLIYTNPRAEEIVKELNEKLRAKFPHHNLK